MNMYELLYRIRSLLLFGFAFFVITTFLSGQQAGSSNAIDALPSWILYEKGKLEFENKEYGKALSIFQKIVQRQAEYLPETQEAIGDVYSADAEDNLAEEKYKLAYSMKEQYIVPDSQYRVLWKLADLYQRKENYKKQEEYLQKIIQDNLYFSDDRYKGLQTSMMDVYQGKGLDSLLLMYRMDSVFAVPAHARLGWFYYQTGRDQQAVLHLMYAIDLVVTRSVADLRTSDPEYVYRDFGSFVNLAYKRKNISDFLDENNFFEVLYHLGCATYAYGKIDRAKEVWTVISVSSQANEYAVLASRQLNSPWQEPHLNLSK